jgi:predicted DNA-binding transcriptional regulator AlpA
MTDTTFPDEMLDRDQVCEVLNITRRKLWQLERAGKAPPSTNLDGAVRYSRNRLNKYMSDLFEVAS